MNDAEVCSAVRLDPNLHSLRYFEYNSSLDVLLFLEYQHIMLLCILLGIITSLSFSHAMSSASQ